MDSEEMEQKIVDAFEFIRRVTEHPERFPDTAVLFLTDPGEVASVVTKQRLQLLRTILGKEHPSILALARSLDRDVSRVRKDLLVLERFGLVHLSRQGNRVRATPAASGIYVPLVAADRRAPEHRRRVLRPR
jgi:predicted transcriptional regulator